MPTRYCSRSGRAASAIPERLANILSAGIATIVQGGCPSVHDASSFDGASAGLDDMLALVDQLLLRRSTASGPSIFICLGHQLAAASHIRLLQRAVREIGKLTRLPLDPSGRVLNSLQRAAERITRMGEQLQVVKQGQPRAIGWNDPDFRGRQQRERRGRHARAAALLRVVTTTPTFRASCTRRMRWSPTNSKASSTRCSRSSARSPSRCSTPTR